ncbi:MAG: geranylgeranylglycerol-phosphate geranylgeranyltransferase [Chloroflexota bacterium]
MRQTIKGLYKISRPMSTLTGVMATILGGYVAGTGEWLNIGLAGLVTLFGAAAANAWNDVQDIEIDRINQPQRPLPSGMVSLETARAFSFVLAALSIIVAFFINWPAFFIAVGTNIILYLYSIRLKSTVLFGNATVAFVSALSAVFGGVAAGNPYPSLWLAAVIFAGIMGREVLKTLADYEGDLAEHVRTISTVWGGRVSRTVFFLLLGVTAIIMLAPYMAHLYRPVYAWIVGLGVIPIAIYVVILVTRYRTGPQLEHLSQVLKWDFLVWFAAVLLGAAR